MFTIGIDEVGRGPVAGPVTVCVFLSKNSFDLLSLFKNRKLKDSKKLSAAERERIYKELVKLKKEKVIDWKLVSRNAEQVDRLGVSKCIYKATLSALNSYKKEYKDFNEFKIFLDGAMSSDFGEVVIKGDEKVIEISCASIIAKVSRDRYMAKMSKTFPEYGFAQNAGYGTAAHLAAIKVRGLTPLHRVTYLKKI